MSLDAHQIVDRRRLARKLTRWRVFAIVLLAALIIGAGYAVWGWVTPSAGAYIARMPVSGFITGDKATVDLLERISEDSNAKALVLAIDSPGGTTTGSEILYDAVRKVAATKPVVAELGTLAASGGYIAAISADHIVTRRNTLTGSIGVIFQWANLSKLLESLGVSVDTVKSAPLKAEPNPFTPENPEAIAAMERLVADSFDWFVGLVAERRNMNPASARALADGRLYTGKQAVENGLVDEIGGEKEIRAWLAGRGVDDPDLPIRDVTPQSRFSALGLAGLARAAGLDTLAGLLSREQAAQAGLLSVWYPQIADR